MTCPLSTGHPLEQTEDGLIHDTSVDLAVSLTWVVARVVSHPIYGVHIGVKVHESRPDPACTILAKERFPLESV